jgi:PKD repeat protein
MAEKCAFPRTDTYNGPKQSLRGMLTLRLHGKATPRTIRTLALGLVLVTVLSGINIGLTGTAHRNLTPSSFAGPTSSGAVQVLAASDSLSRGEGPALGHAVLPTSPGGYSWTNLTSTLFPAPGARLTNMVWDASDGYVLLWGSQTTSGYLTDTWTYLNGTWKDITLQVNNHPPKTSLAAMAYDPSSQKVVLYCGANVSTWIYHANLWSNVTPTAGSPPGRISLESFVTDSTDNQAFLAGGQYLSNGAQFHFTWSFKNGMWNNLSGSAPFNFGRIYFPSLSDDPPDHGVLAFGLAQWHNVTPLNYRPATFLFAAGSWTNLTTTLTTQPPMSLVGGFGYLPSISSVVLAAPLLVNSTGSAISYGATWEFSQHSWVNVTAVTNLLPRPEIFVGNVVIPTDNSMLLFGGEQLPYATLYPDTWIFSAPPSLSASVSRSVFDAGQTVTLTGSVAGGASPVVTQWNLGDGSTANPLIASHSYARTGLITATLSATDLAGHSSSVAVSFYVNPAPNVTLTLTPLAPVAGSGAGLSAQLVGGTAPFTYAWKLGDNSVASSPSVGHTYASAGTYQVTLTVTDAVGAQASASTPVVVSAAPSTSASLNSGTGLYLLIGIIVLVIVVALLVALLLRRPRPPQQGPPAAFMTGPSMTYPGGSPTYPTSVPSSGGGPSGPPPS